MKESNWKLSRRPPRHSKPHSIFLLRFFNQRLDHFGHFLVLQGHVLHFALNVRERLRKAVDLDDDIALLFFLICLAQDHALTQLAELLIQLFEVLCHNLVCGLLHGVHLTLPRLQTTEFLIWLDNVEDE